MRPRSLPERTSRGAAASCLRRRATTRSCLAPPRPNRRTSRRLPSLLALRPPMAARSVPPISDSMRPCAAIDGVSHGSRRQSPGSRRAATSPISLSSRLRPRLRRAPRLLARRRRSVLGPPPGKSPASTPAEIEGQLSVERMPLCGVLALALGPPQPGRTGARWSDVRFAPVPLRPPSAAVKLRVGTLDLADALTARDFATTLRFDKGRLDLDDFAMRIAGGGASGHATLRRDADNVTLTGALALDSVALDRTGFSGRIGAALDFASTGRSPAALINGLAGSGTVTFAGAALARSDPTALDRVVAKAQTPDAPLDETNIAFAFGNELNRAPLAIPDGSAPLSLSAGVMKIGPIKIPGRTRGRGAERGSRSAHANDTGALYAHLLGERFEVLVGTAAERGGDGRQCAWRRRSGRSTSAPFPPRSPRRRSRARPIASPRWKPTSASAPSSTGVSRASG